MNDHYGQPLLPGTPVAVYGDTGGAEDGTSGGVILVPSEHNTQSNTLSVLWTGDGVEFPTQVMEVVNYETSLDMGAIFCQDLIVTTANYLIAQGSKPHQTVTGTILTGPGTPDPFWQVQDDSGIIHMFDARDAYTPLGDAAKADEIVVGDRIRYTQFY